jgi:hypothetical protein
VRQASFALAGSAAALALGAAIGWSSVQLASGPDRVAFAVSNVFTDTLKSTGRLRTIQFDASGRVSGVSLETPEMVALGDAFDLESIRMLDDGGLLLVPYTGPDASPETRKLPRDGLRLGPRDGTIPSISSSPRHD